MKKLFFIVIMVLGFGLYSFSQVSSNAIGLRLGGGTVSGGEISYQRGFNERNRLELDLGFGGNKDYSSFSLIGVYHWDWNIVEGLNWFVGPGAGLSFVNSKHSNDYFNIAIGGQIGLEYDFNTLGAPILLSLDARPMWDFIGDYSGFGWGFALGVRYTF